MEDFFDLYLEGFSWVFFGFAFCWGVSGLIRQWDKFGEKLINTILTIGVIVFCALVFSSNDFVEMLGVLAGGASALFIGNRISERVDGDWNGIAAIIGAIAFIVMFIILGSYLS